MMRLTFDWDGVSLQDTLVQNGLAKLSHDFPAMMFIIGFRLRRQESTPSFPLHHQEPLHL